MTLDIDAILADATGQERTVRLLLRGDLRARWDALAAELEGASSAAASLGDVAPATRIAREMDELREQVRAAEVPFRLRALEPRAWSKFMDSKPERTKEHTDEEWSDTWHLFACKVVSVTCVDPVMTPEQVDRLSTKLSNAQWLELTNAAWGLNTEREQVPFSAAAYALIQIDGGRSKQPGPPASPSRSSSAGRPAKSPRTNTTRKAGQPKP